MGVEPSDVRKSERRGLLTCDNGWLTEGIAGIEINV